MEHTPTDHIKYGPLKAALRQILPPGGLLEDQEALRPYECDGLMAKRELPLWVALPDAVDQIQQIMRLCHRYHLPVVARGAGTSLSGGAMPIANGLLLSLVKLNRIIEVDGPNRVARVEPGVRNAVITEAVANQGLYYAPDPSSQIACTIGGNVAENAGGLHCLKYGLTIHNVLKVKVITIEGEMLTIGSDSLDAPGYDLLALMMGSEGMLGIVVEVTVRLLPQPETARLLLAAFDSVEVAGDAVAAIIAKGLIPGGLEMMDRLAISAAEEFVHAGYPVDAEAILLCELDGTRDEVEAQVAETEALLLERGATAVRVAADEKERQLFWSGRKSAFPAVGRISPDYYCMDGTIPRRHLGEVLGQINALSRQYDLRVANVFHAGDGNLHPLILYDANKQGELERAEELGGKILEVCVEVGGTITGEHGVGVEKLDQMCVQFTPLELDQFRKVKSAFDPEWLLNPGKVIPENHRCAELGGMHVHRGQTRHPEIERF
ncbi:MAG: FAD-linked oxidase C-terminal domain-containing protein [Arenicellales bacterium]|jgi:glycolate oxidase|nr:FAD-binding oxidoreductase [Acidiferrobacteraceae bacterium]MDP6123731.1 FAD-linked oxidase C-terminal domain-containing protein [Arenicellales bacterium]MDP7156240.1 FAD-linked oxidase C-terminal domain-containing protein [Arenicellales bacterium]MDP7283704.1 FAD-linked oxidase C-terminal domain-containing protein [Arenicellales bacterium]MDP7453227.1 FAD-linked oxidase C-terminal domain-containing protein [Arenicellales bacterium]|tara:strand:+ start:260 stop:1738 length:1479 start_codon:yes stop_codon:yes gene_type:complete